jgi:hypothetical protein
MQAPRLELDPKIKNSLSQLKILMKLNEICCRLFDMIQSYYVQIIAIKLICGPHPKIKISCSHLRILRKLTEICCR